MAETFGGEIVNCDSIQVYRGLNIGSAKLPIEARRGIPHHLIDVASPDRDLTAGDYARLGRPLLDEIRNRHRTPVMVGGTGFYLRALLDGLSPAPERDYKLRERLGMLSQAKPGALHRYLRRYDARSATRIHPNDHQKLIRAIEMSVIGRQPASQIQSSPRQALSGFSVLKLCLLPDRQMLRDRIDRRASRMFENGLLEETQRLLDWGYSPEAKPLQSIGYKQAMNVLFGRSSVAEAIEECQTRTRQYAKRQMTWFRGEPNVIWLPGFGTDSAIQNCAAVSVGQFLLFASETALSETGQQN